MPLPSGEAVNAGMILLQPGSGTEYATNVRVVAGAGPEVPPATSLDPPPQAATSDAVTASAAAARQRRTGGTMFMGDLSWIFEGAEGFENNDSPTSQKGDGSEFRQLPKPTPDRGRD